MQTYLNFLQHIRDHGIQKSDRTGTGTYSIFGYQMRFDLQTGFPLVTTKKIHIKSVIHELLWMLKGDTNIQYLQENGVRIWNEWATETGDLGPIYGAQWRNWQSHPQKKDSVDQIAHLIEQIKHNPNSRRLVVSAWNPSFLPNDSLSPQENVHQGKSALPPCHAFFQFYVVNNQLSCMLTQRSADAFLGVPFNIASYSLLTHMIAQQCGLKVGEFIWSGGDCHIYTNHLEQIETQLTRTPYSSPKLIIHRKPDDIFGYQYEDFEITEYKHHPHLSGKVAV